MTRRAAFLDRDGVLIDTPWRDGKPSSARVPAEAILLPGVPEAVARLRRAGWLTVMVTNQPGIASGTIGEAEARAINAGLRETLGLDDVRMCPHREEDGCACRKPKPGMLLAAAEALGIDLARSVMVGDRWRDVGAGRAAGCRTIWIDRDYFARGLKERTPEAPDHTCRSLPEAVALILDGEPG